MAQASGNNSRYNKYLRTVQKGDLQSSPISGLNMKMHDSNTPHFEEDRNSAKYQTGNFAEHL